MKGIYFSTLQCHAIGFDPLCPTGVVLPSFAKMPESLLTIVKKGIKLFAESNVPSRGIVVLPYVLNDHSSNQENILAVFVIADASQ